MTNMLKPCPFCASRNLDIYAQMHEGNDVGCKVVCERCWSSGPLMNGATEEQACSLWNARRNKTVQLQKHCDLLFAFGAEGPRGRDSQECEERWNQRREWVPFREAVDMPEFRYGIRYPAKFPTASEPHRYGWVEANKKDDGRMFYYVNGWHKQTLDTRADNLWGEPIVGDVLVLVSALEEYADQEDER
ncbi:MULTISPECIES: hypothetical protein [unclassified Saccharibacter]|uniref:hypothetical protein n=1 Tax=unclassified Saccharibacter TaxID=2648722 RepID=UPI001EF10766|nr:MULTISPECIES: hypothetical protein [unclassified Saccharibacter]